MITDMCCIIYKWYYMYLSNYYVHIFTVTNIYLFDLLSIFNIAKNKATVYTSLSACCVIKFKQK